MKSYNKMANDVIRRINEYESEKQRKRRIIIKDAIGLCCLTFLLIGIFVFPMIQRQSDPSPLESTEISTENDLTMHFIDNSESTKTENTDLPNTSPESTGMESTDDSDETEEMMPDKQINIISLFQPSTGEFAADMHRPDGFNKNIGSVLAIKMNMSDDPEDVYPVIISNMQNSDMEQIIDYVNNIYDAKIVMKDILHVNISGIINTSQYTISLC